MPKGDFVRIGSTKECGASRLLFVVGQLHTGGLERQLYALLRSIDRDGYRPAVAVWRYAATDIHVSALQELGIPLYAIPGDASRLTKLKSFRRLAKQLEPEVIHSYSFHTNVAAAWAAWGTRAVAVGSIRSDFGWAKKESGPLLGRLCARWPGYQISNSVAAAASAGTSRSFFAPARCDVVCNGLDLDKFRMNECRTVDPARILGLGYLLPVKRWDRVLGAAAKLKQQGIAFEVKFVGDGPLRSELQEQARLLDVLECVQFVPHTDNIPGVLGEASFVVLTSESEGTPNVVMEAMACGRAVIATDVGDISRLVQDGISGFVIPAGDDVMLAERMAALVNDPGLSRRMGEAGRRRAEREFGVERLVRDTLAAYRKAGWNERDPGPARLKALVGD